MGVDIADHIIADREVRAPSTMAETFETLYALGLLSPELTDSMKKAVGFRNIAMHRSTGELFSMSVTTNWTIFAPLHKRL